MFAFGVQMPHTTNFDLTSQQNLLGNFEWVTFGLIGFVTELLIWSWGWQGGQKVGVCVRLKQNCWIAWVSGL